MNIGSEQGPSRKGPLSAAKKVFVGQLQEERNLVVLNTTLNILLKDKYFHYESRRTSRSRLSDLAPAGEHAIAGRTAPSQEAMPSSYDIPHVDHFVYTQMQKELKPTSYPKLHLPSFIPPKTKITI